MNDLELITENKLNNYLSIAGIGDNLTDSEKKNFLQIAMDFNLNPFKREIYCTSYGKGEYKKTSIIVGYEVYIKRAERTGQLDGWNVVTSGSVASGDLVASITIHRKDRKFPFLHEVHYSEYVQTTFDQTTKTYRANKFWAEKPITMLKKVCTGQGFRLCFSDELGGMPYDSSELPIEEKNISDFVEPQKIEPQKVEPKKEAEKIENPKFKLKEKIESCGNEIEKLKLLMSEFSIYCRENKIDSGAKIKGDDLLRARIYEIESLSKDDSKEGKNESK